MIKRGSTFRGGDNGGYTAIDLTREGVRYLGLWRAPLVVQYLRISDLAKVVKDTGWEHIILPDERTFRRTYGFPKGSLSTIVAEINRRTQPYRE